MGGGEGKQRTALMAACSLRSAARYAGLMLPLGRKMGMPYFDLPLTCDVCGEEVRHAHPQQKACVLTCAAAG